jgi:hypothetical protein
LTEHKFNLADQQRFAQLSGDYNPAHIDPVKARRLIFGRPVVHGMHALLWSLEDTLKGKTGPLQLLQLKVSFKRAIGIEETVSILKKKETSEQIEWQLATDVAPSAHVIVSYEARHTTDENSMLNEGLPPKTDCKELDAKQIEQARGHLKLYFDTREMQRQFPYLTKLIPPCQLAQLLSLTRLVGMECPGLHSIFSDLNVQFSDKVQSSAQLQYNVTRYEPRLSLANIAVSASGMEGNLKAFLRPALQVQESYVQLSQKIQTLEFSQQNALVVGGSRGLGEVTAKLLAAGGAKTTLTYNQGAEEAQAIVDEVTLAGGNITSIHFDILSPKSVGENITHLYYFPTPYIHAGAHRSFSHRLFSEFCDYYVGGFLNTVRKVQENSRGPLKCFYPSSIAIDELPPNMGEYSAAKIAGETLCSWLMKTDPQLSIFQTRLPRTQTDQTASLLPADKDHPAALMLKHLRCFQDEKF